MSFSYSAATVSIRGERYAEVSVSDERANFDGAHIDQEDERRLAWQTTVDNKGHGRRDQLAMVKMTTMGSLEGSSTIIWTWFSRGGCGKSVKIFCVGLDNSSANVFVSPRNPIRRPRVRAGSTGSGTLNWQDRVSGNTSSGPMSRNLPAKAPSWGQQHHEDPSRPL